MIIRDKIKEKIIFNFNMYLKYKIEIFFLFWLVLEEYFKTAEFAPVSIIVRKRSAIVIAREYIPKSLGKSNLARIIVNIKAPILPVTVVKKL